MAPIVLYYSPGSPYCRSVLLLARYLKLDVDIKYMDLHGKKEQLTPEFLAINPQHTIPTIDDNGFILWESRAILTYLIESKAPELVPTSPKEKAIVNQRLHYELGGLTNKTTQIVSPLFSGERDEADPEKVKELHEILFIIDENYFPNGNEWIAGEVLTAADFAFVSSISTLVGFGVSLDKYPRLQAWMKRCQDIMPEYEEVNQKGVEMLVQFFSAKFPEGIKGLH
ncbi:glutathione S-transferase 1-1-like [Chironomus tepperi]|uniref:glutathione S-transferase 1-1-like n=1 Tax=Chironomus tepperi TaxID=113505 RepID=UPI00391FC596